MAGLGHSGRAMGFGDWFKAGSKQQAKPAVVRPEEWITVFDERGRERRVKRQDWFESVLRPAIDKASADPNALYDLVVQALRDDFIAQVAPAAEHLVRLDAESERSLIIAGIVRMKGGDLAGAERALAHSVAKHGETGVVLTNLAKVFDERGDKKKAVATLRRALDLDPNQDNALLWWAAIAKDGGGDSAYDAALEEIAALPRAWRPQLWLARRKLQQADRAGALRLYEHVLLRAADEPNVLMMVTGDLGKAGALKELVELAASRYAPEIHGPTAGLNIIEALKQLGRSDEARAAIRRLRTMNWAPFAARLGELESQIAASSAPRPEESAPKVAIIVFDAPLWTRGLFDPTWLLPARSDAVPHVTFFTLANALAAGGAQQIQTTNGAGRLTRAIPLYLAETVLLQLEAQARSVVFVVPGAGPVVFGKSLEREALEKALPARSGARIAVAGTLVEGGIELRIWEAGSADTGHTLLVEGSLSDPGALAAKVEEGVAAILTERYRVAPARPPALYRAAPARSLAGYLSALDQLLYQVLIANKMVPAESMWNERGYFETYFNLIESWPNAPDTARFIAICGVVAGVKYASTIVEPYKKAVLKWIHEADPKSELGRVAPAVFKRLGETAEVEAWFARPRAATDSDYAVWLERVRSGE
jgi:tetratricopeptide (TPR) repeat protein